MAFNIALLKEHPYAVGGVVIVGGIVVFYLLSSSSGSTGTASSGNNNYAAALSADTQLQQVAAAAQIQTSAQQAQLQQTALQAQVANTQTAASLTASNTNTYASLIAALAGNSASVSENSTNVQGATTQQANQLLYAQNIQQMQDNVLTDQINQAGEENANNNATSLSALQDQLTYQGGVATQELTDATQIASQQTANQFALANTIIPMAGNQQNSALDATDQTALFQTILSGGNASVASSGNAATSSATKAGDAQSTALAAGITSGISSIAAGFFA